MKKEYTNKQIYYGKIFNFFAENATLTRGLIKSFVNV